MLCCSMQYWHIMLLSPSLSLSLSLYTLYCDVLLLRARDDAEVTSPPAAPRAAAA